ncbi:MAG: hypothetical protein JWO82_129 [Akkermansiaceae bacterium]|nr:hypothetical protein [Akkermansiaceae bacterium]
MKSLSRYLLPLLLLTPLGAAEEAPDARLREALKNTILQLRAAQGETAKAQSDAIAADEKAKALQAKVTELEQRNQQLAKQSNDDKVNAEKSISGLNNKLADREKRLADYIAAIDKWKAGYEALTLAARNTDGERAKLADEVIVLKRTIADRERKNLALFNLSNEILTRYENFSLGKSLAAKEPFIGTSRVQVENLVQGYKNHILDNRLSAPAAKP